MRTTALTSLEDLATLSKSIETTLKAHGVVIAPGSALEGYWLSATALADWKRSLQTSPGAVQLREHIRYALGFFDLTRKVEALKGHAEFPKFVPHLRLLNGSAGVSGEPGTSGVPLQNLEARGDQYGDKIFELLIGLAALRIGNNLELDDPERPSGRNPDVLIDIRGKRWGFACKVPSGDAPMTLFQNIEKGVDQIENSSADAGLVVCNFKNRFPHDSLLRVLRPEGAEPILAVEESTEAVSTRLAGLMEGYFADMVNFVTPGEVEKPFHGRKAAGAALGACQVAIGLETPLGPMPTLIGVLKIHPLAPQALDAELATVLRMLNFAFHDLDPPGP